MPIGNRTRGGAWLQGVASLVALAVLPITSSAAPAPPPSIDSDSAAVQLVKRAYDSWTVPWVQLSGLSPMLAPASNATLMVLSCESAAIQRARILDHLSPEECEHRMAAARTDQDTALIFRLDLRAFDFPGGMTVAHLGQGVSLRLEDDRGQQWEPSEIIRGPIVTVASGEKLRRIYYNPPWQRGNVGGFGSQYGLSDGHSLTVAEHRLRFPRHDRSTAALVLGRDVRWVRLHMTYASYQWVATWTFRTPVVGNE